MKRIPASQLTQSHYGQRVTYSIPVRRGQSVQTMTLGHVHVEPPWVIIRAKGAHPFDAVRIPYDSIVEVRA